MRPHPLRVPTVSRFHPTTGLSPRGRPGLRFVDFLVQQGALSRGAAAGSLAADDGFLAWFGTLAVLLGYLDRAAIDRVLRHQARSQLEFEDVAVAIGLLTLEERAEIDDLRDRLGVTLVEVSTALGHMRPERVGEMLRGFRKCTAPPPAPTGRRHRRIS